MLFQSLAFGQEFPSGWIGNYTGDMIIGSTSRPNDTLSVEFILQEVEKDSAWTYTMTYHSDRLGDITKDYMIVSSKKGDTINYLLDELNGIVMELSLLNNCFYGMYDVQGQRYIFTLRRLNQNELFFELFVSGDTPPYVTTAEEDGEEFVASSYKTVMHQSVHLKRKDG